MRKIISIILLFFLVFSYLGCKTNGKSNNSKDDLEWTNEEAVYVSIKKEYLSSIFDNIEKEFSNYSYEKVYVVDKNTNDDGSLYYRLLFIVKKDIDSFCDKLRNDERISSLQMSSDLPFESYDNRYMEYDKNPITVGESINIFLNGDSHIYYQRFLFNAVYFKPVNYNFRNEYNISDYPEIEGISFIDKNINGLTIYFTSDDYYKVVKTVDILSRNPSNLNAGFLEINVMHPIWEIDNEECVSFIVNNDNSITLTALKEGTVKVRFDGIGCTITIVS